MTLDVLIPTLNRAPFLEGALRSLLVAEVPPDLRVLITVIDNGCTDGTVEMIRRMAVIHPGRIQLIRERRRGKSRALNAALSVTHGELVGMIDDDEEVTPGWFREVRAAFQDPAVDFVGGPYFPLWRSPAPAWIPPDYMAVIGGVDCGPEPLEYGPGFPGILKGGNAVIRRRTLERVGPFAEHLGPGGPSRLLSCEDEEMYVRLLEAGARGRYLPGMGIHHHVSPERLSRGYYRQWCFWRGVSRGLMDRDHQMPVAYLAGVPRFLYGEAVRGAWRLLTAPVVRRSSREAFAAELKLWDLWGYWYGRNVYPLARLLPVRSRRNPSSPPRRPEVVIPAGQAAATPAGAE